VISEGQQLVRLGRRILGSHWLLLADSTSSRMAPESGLWKNERIANVGYLEPIPGGSPRPGAEVRPSLNAVVGTAAALRDLP